VFDLLECHQVIYKYNIIIWAEKWMEVTIIEKPKIDKMPYELIVCD